MFEYEDDDIVVDMEDAGDINVPDISKVPHGKSLRVNFLDIDKGRSNELSK